MTADIATLVTEATIAANMAGKAWMDNARPMYVVRNADLVTGKPIGPALGTMLDMCGNAHVQFSDRRAKVYKDFLKAGFVRGSGNGVVEIEHAYRGRQEHGLMMACAKAAKAKLEEHGVAGLRIWDYID